MNKQNPIKEVNELKEGCGEVVLKVGYNRAYCDGEILCKVCKAKLQTLQKVYKEFAEVLGEEIEFLKNVKMLDERTFCDKDIQNRISHLKQLKKEYEEGLK